MPHFYFSLVLPFLFGIAMNQNPDSKNLNILLFPLYPCSLSTNSYSFSPKLYLEINLINLLSESLTWDNTIPSLLLMWEGRKVDCNLLYYIPHFLIPVASFLSQHQFTSTLPSFHSSSHSLEINMVLVIGWQLKESVDRCQLVILHTSLG